MACCTNRRVPSICMLDHHEVDRISRMVSPWQPEPAHPVFSRIPWSISSRGAGWATVMTLSPWRFAPVPPPN